MEKKKIAVFATGYASEILYQYLIGAREEFADYPVDMYLFVCHPTFMDTDAFFQGEVNIFKLPNLEDFDGVMVLANTIDFPAILQDINDRSRAAGIPVVYTGNDKQGGFFVGSDNYVGARALCDHIIEVHGAKEIVYIAGSRDSMDSNTRMKALSDALEAKGLALKEENVFYSNWGPTEAWNFIKGRLADGQVPDAIVCANDTLAMIFSKELNERGYAVPGRIIVTGFDNDPYAQIYDPVLSTVDQRFDLLGKKSAETLIRTFQGLPCEQRQTIPCEFVPGESCGCTTAKDFGMIRKALGRKKFVEDTKSSVFDESLFAMERSIFKGTSYQDLRESFRAIHTTRQMDYQGYSFHVVLDPNYEKCIYNQDRKLREDGYPAVMDDIFSVIGSDSRSDPKFETRRLVPMPMEDGKNHQYLFLPLHEGAGSMGYIIFCDMLEKIQEDLYLRKYIQRMSLLLWSHLKALQLAVLHTRLLEMTETDALTHVKNRTAYRAREEKIQAKLRASREVQFAVAVFDVNDLKKVNDNYGHEAGDEYIISACQLICKTFKKSAVYRIGGDEFAVVLENEDYQFRETLIKCLQNKLEELKKTPDLPVTQKVSIASGMAEFDSASDRDYADVFNRADAKMYENKAIMKRKV